MELGMIQCWIGRHKWRTRSNTINETYIVCLRCSKRFNPPIESIDEIRKRLEPLP